MVMSFGRMSEPLTKVQKVDSTTTAKSYNFAYKYEDSNHPTAPTQIGHDHYTYDANGNPTLVTNDSANTTREMYWDEDNRLMVLSDNGKTSRYTYNASGERIMKSYGTMEGVYINGAPQGITLTDVDFRLHQDKMSKLFCAWFALKFHETDNFTLYPASIISINKNRFTKHYFIGDKRVASRIGTGLFNNVYGRNGSYVTAGQQDYAERMNQIQTQKEAYYKKVGVAPGVPTEKGAYGDPENTGVGYNSVLTELGNHDVPQGWIQTPRPNTTPNTNPGPPVSWNDPSNPDDPQAGYGYIPNDTTKEETFFYHSDHLGSTSYITDDKANITQYDAYLPYGELLVDEHSSSEDLPYKFNGKQFDEETGLYYYGARYLNPMTSIWYGVDPLAGKFPLISGYSYCGGSPIILRDKDGRRPTGHEAALMARAVYRDENEKKDLKELAKAGWFISNIKTSIRSNMNYTKLGENGLQSTIFQRTNAKTGKTEYAYVFAGTNSIEDGIEDISQVTLGAPQYNVAIDNARKLSNELKDSELTFVGHSLGGGLAAAASMATGKAAITFNRASVSDRTKSINNLGTLQNVTDYQIIGKKALWGLIRLGGDPLSNLQDNIGIGAKGRRILIESNDYLWHHSIDNFVHIKLPN